MQITSNGTFRVGKDGAGEITLLGSGTFGGATVLIGYLTNKKDPATFVTIPESEATQTSTFSVTYTKGSGTYAAVSVTGGSGVDIHLNDHSYM